MKKNYTKIVLDLLMAITFVLLMNPRVLNGLPFHEIAGLVIGVAILVHIGLNYRWVINTTKKIVDAKLPPKTRFSYLLNILLLISMAAVIITGILISKVVLPSFAVQEGHSIRGLHGFTADATLALVGLHIGVHWQWVLSICKKAFKSKEGKLRMAVITSVVFSLAILAGGLQWYSATASSNLGPFNSKPMLQIDGGRSFQNGNTGNITNTDQESLKGDFREGRFHGKDGHGGSSNPFLVVLNYFAIWAAIIIPTCFLERRFLRNKQKAKLTHPKHL
ncbi:hypothetical protein BABA_04464 [Neobacillus bataviensis LMG 21833]|uniref:Flavinylation-associated cytochrome domain-containing protein n=1 Tax=Neobacillus bataviensis LMG 21833 TaxID=1117379 RepID=K6EB65_9BACI|nr:DUF4405 domain-containing protein [Neobacillus bataviensis]EKN70666.1 hypothetical protein BABA_04464 [Neobacillus bataviensis LMG 21833]